MKNSGEPTTGPAGARPGSQIASAERAEDRPHERAHQRRAQRPTGLAFLGHGMAVDDNGGGGGFARDAEQDRGDVAGGGGHGRHPEQERESLHRRHRENERKHQRQRDRPADARQDPHHEADGNPHQLERECLPGKELDQALETGIEDIDHRRVPAGRGAENSPAVIPGRRHKRVDARLRRAVAAGPESRYIGISCVSGFRARAFGAPRNDASDFFSSLRAAVTFSCRPRVSGYLSIWPSVRD